MCAYDQRDAALLEIVRSTPRLDDDAQSARSQHAMSSHRRMRENWTQMARGI